jgi:hypothetical protein
LWVVLWNIINHVLQHFYQQHNVALETTIT